MNMNAFIITDCEIGIRNAIKRNMKDVKLLRCWGNLFKSIERWLLFEFIISAHAKFKYTFSDNFKKYLDSHV